MKNLIFLAKRHLCILLTFLLILLQFFLPYRSNATNDVISIHLIGDHNSDTYWFGQCLVPLKINAYMENGNDVGSIPVEKSWISGYNSEKLGKQTVTITYGGKTTNFTVTVVDYLKSIAIVGLKQNYTVGEPLDLSGVSITEITASGIQMSGKTITKNMISGFNTSTPGVKKLTINYHKNELGENITLDTFITVSDSIPETSTPISDSNILESNSSDSSILSNIYKKANQYNYSNINTENNETIDTNKDTKISLNDILKNIFNISEVKLDEESINSTRLIMFVITRLSILFI